MKAQTVKEALVAIRWIIDHHNWCQGTMFLDKNGFCISKDRALVGDLYACCAIGATHLVDANDGVVLEARRLMRVKTKDDSIIAWNDKQGRTKEEVLDLLDKLIGEQP
jgi:hypothetical protein